MSESSGMAAPNQCCYDVAVEHNEGRLSDELYIRHLFSHSSEPRPPLPVMDETFWAVGRMDRQIRNIDPFAFLVRCFVRDNFNTNTEQFENVFTAYRNGSLEDVKAALESIEEPRKRPEWPAPEKALQWDVKECLVLLALQDRRADVVRYLFEPNQLRLEDQIQEEAQTVKKIEDPQTYKVLEDHYFGHPVYSDFSDHWNYDDDDYDPGSAKYDDGGPWSVDWVKSKRSTFGDLTDVGYMIPTNRHDTIWVLDGETWEYAVRTDCGDAVKSPWSAEVSAKASPSVPPGPRKIVVNPSSRGFNARWQPPGGSWSVERYEIITYDKDQPCDFSVSRGVKGTSEPLPPQGGFVVGTLDATTVILNFNGDKASANYRVWSRNINNVSDSLKADEYASDVPCYGVAYLFPGVWNFELCVSALNGNLESAKSKCIIPSKKETPGLEQGPSPQANACGFGAPGNGGDGTNEPGAPGSGSNGGGGSGGGEIDDGSGDVYIDPSIWDDTNPEVSCDPPCNFILPPRIYPSPKTIELPPYTTDYEVVWTVSGKVTRTVETTTATLPPVTTKTISFWTQSFPPGPPFTFSPIPRIVPSPFTVVRDPKPESSLSDVPVTRTITPWPYPTEIQDDEDGDDDDDDYGGPHPSVTIKKGPPGPICSSGCGSPCIGGSCGSRGRPCVPLLTCPRGDDWHDPAGSGGSDGDDGDDDDDVDDDDDEEEEEPWCSFPGLDLNPPDTRGPKDDEKPDIRTGEYPGPSWDPSEDGGDGGGGGGGGGGDGDGGGGSDPTQRVWVFYVHIISELEDHMEWWFIHRPLDGSSWDVCGEQNDVECSNCVKASEDSGDMENPPWPDGEWELTRGKAKGCVYSSNGSDAGKLSCDGKGDITCQDAAVVDPELRECPPIAWRADFYPAVICDYV
ncbi:hypothetical protein ACJ41O_008847 [Fusarium nematophilum]